MKQLLTTVTEYNYIAPLYLFYHYIFGNGETVHINLKDVQPSYKWEASYLALGHYNYEAHQDLYDFNVNEWPDWLVLLGKPFLVTW